MGFNFLKFQHFSIRMFRDRQEKKNTGAKHAQRKVYEIEHVPGLEDMEGTGGTRERDNGERENWELFFHSVDRCQVPGPDRRKRPTLEARFRL